MLSLVLSFILASIWVSLATVATERLGTKTGGVITTLPSTLVVALLFMGIEGGNDLAASAAAVVPAEMGVNAVFLAVFIIVSGYGLWRALACAFGAWFSLSFLIFILDLENLVLSIVIFFVLMLVSSLWLRRRHGFTAKKGRVIHYTPREIAFRGLFAGVMIAFSVLLASLSGPVLGGIFSVFPAIFTSTMVILYLRQGREFTGAAGRTMILGSVNVVFYAGAVYYSFPSYGPVMGTIISLVTSHIWAFAVFLLVKKYQT